MGRAVKALKRDIVEAVPEMCRWLRAGLVDVFFGLVNIEQSLLITPDDLNKKGTFTKKQKAVVSELGGILEAFTGILSSSGAVKKLPDIVARVLFELSKEKAVFPKSFLLEVEEDYMDLDVLGRASNMSLQRRRLIIANFILSRTLIAEMMLNPDKYSFVVEASAAPPKSKKKKNAVLGPVADSPMVRKNCAVVATILYALILRSVGEPGEDPVDVEPQVVESLVPIEDMAVLLQFFRADGSFDRWSSYLRTFLNNVTRATVTRFG